MLGLLIGLWLLFELRSIVALLLAALALATGIHPIVEWIHARRLPPRGWQIPRWLAILSVLLFIVIGAAALFYFLGATLWREATQFWDDLPGYADGLNDWVNELRKQFPQIPTAQELGAAAQEQIGRLGQYLWQTTSAVLGVLGLLGSALTVLVLTFYMLLEKEALRRAFRSLIPPGRRERITEVNAEAFETMGGWLRGQAILVLFVSTLIGIAMAVLGLPHPILLGMAGGIGELIPMVGPILAGWIAVPLAFATLPLWAAIATLVFFIVLSIVEANVIVPKVMEKNVDLSPFFTVVAVLAGASLSGVIGALLALPIAAALRIYLKRLVVPAIQKQPASPVRDG